MTARKWGSSVRSAAALAAVVLLAIAAPSTAFGQNEGPVTGTVKLADPSQRGEPPERNEGFHARRPNPIIAPRPHNPLPWVIVVLEPIGLDLTDDQKGPPKVPPVWELIGESFHSPVFPVAVNGEIQIKNVGNNSHRLYSPTVDGLLPGDVVNPKGVRKVKVTTTHKPIVVRDHDSTHLGGTIVGFPLRYFSLVDEDGKFSIDDVPAGKWKVRVWYRDGWLKMKGPEVSVSPRRGGSATLTLPPNLQIQPGT